MANADRFQDIYSYQDEESEEEPYLYSPGEINVNNDEDYESNQLESEPEVRNTYYNDSTQVPFYGSTTNGATYTWKVPNKRERLSKAGSQDTEEDDSAAQKIPFYSETTHRSQYLPFDASVRRTRLSQRNQQTPTSNIPIEMETTYRSLYPAQTIGKREKTIHTCPAEKILHQRSVLMTAKPRNGHYFIPCESSSTNNSTSLLNQRETNAEK